RWARKAGFEILEVLTWGLRDVVCKARDVDLNRLVALKVLTGVGTEAEEVKRFRGEAQALAQLRHPNIVQSYRFGEVARRPYFSMGHADGGSLVERYLAQPLQPPPAAATLVATLARAVRYAHDQGHLHGALKPSNVLVARDGTPKIANFGLLLLLEKEQGEA